jgi:hypothetical protein
MSRILLKILVGGAMAVSALVSASSSSALVWTTNGSVAGTPFTATAPAAKITISGVSSSVTCTGASTTGRWFGPTGAPPAPVGRLTLLLSSCRVGGLNFSGSCGTEVVDLNPVSYSSPAAGIELASTASPICTFTTAIVPTCRLTMSPSLGTGRTFAVATYNNTTGQLTLDALSQTLTATWSSCGTLFGAASGVAVMRLANTAGANLVYTVTSTFVPNIVI